MGADERDGWLRAAWRKLVAEGIDAGRLVVFVETRWARRTRRSRRSSPGRDGGAGAYAKAPRNRGEDTTLLASVTRDGGRAVPGGRGKHDDQGGLRGVRRAGPGVLAPARAGVVVLDDLRPTRGACPGAGGGEGLRAPVPAAQLLAGPRPHRGGVPEGQGAAAKDRSEETREAR